MAKWSDLVGERFRFDSCVYRCTARDPSGLHMVMESGTGVLFPERKPGDTTCISERAVGRTYHQIYSYKEPTSGNAND